MTNPLYGEASPERIAETNALLAAYEAVTDHASYWPAYGAVEQRMNSEDLMGRWDEAERIRVEMNRITRKLKPMLDAQYRAIRTHSTAELIARAQSANAQPIDAYDTINAATDAFCAMLTSRYADSVREPSVHMAGEGI